MVFTAKKEVDKTQQRELLDGLLPVGGQCREHHAV